MFITQPFTQRVAPGGAEEYRLDITPGDMTDGEMSNGLMVRKHTSDAAGITFIHIFDDGVRGVVALTSAERRALIDILTG